MLPGFARLTGSDSDFWWVSHAAAILDSIAFLDIKQLENESNSAVQDWKRFAIKNQCPKVARADELQLYTATWSLHVPEHL